MMIQMYISLEIFHHSMWKGTISQASLNEPAPSSEKLVLVISHFAMCFSKLLFTNALREFSNFINISAFLLVYKNLGISSKLSYSNTLDI